MFYDLTRAIIHTDTLEESKEERESFLLKIIIGHARLGKEKEDYALIID